MTATSGRTVTASVDDHLGPAEQRFFGRGFRRVGYDLGELRLARGADGTVRAASTVGVTYPADWSKKAAGTDLRPHFSTVDGLVVAAQLTEACLAGSVPQRHGAWLRRVRMTAGSSPQEHLDGLPAEATLRRTDPLPAEPGHGVSSVDCAIGTMRVRCEVVHPLPAGTPDDPHTYVSPAALLGPAADRYFGTGFTTRGQSIHEVAVDRGALRADALLTVNHEDGAAVPTVGLEGAYQPSVSMIDAFVTALQLAQIMLYDLDGMRRQDSNTLWMRQTTLTASRPDRPTEAIPVTTRLEEPGLLRMAGGTWRTLDVVAELAGLRVRSAVAHQLPEGSVAA
ncbi:AvrD family protein [Streptomyces nigra]|uniref:AvrD family protein n=1 Tax=Streptomyces nigra TaxID=1827580 RepID=UPI003829AD0E